VFVAGSTRLAGAAEASRITLAAENRRPPEHRRHAAERAKIQQAEALPPPPWHAPAPKIRSQP
jgi:hypothetical protein